MHVNVRIHPTWSFTEVRRAALALSRAVERRVPTLASSKWWKEERHGVFLDYNQNAKDRTTSSAYSVRPLPDARVSAPLHWHEVPDCDPADFTVLTMPQRFADHGDPHADMDAAAGSLESLLELAARDEAEGLGDAPWPPHFRKAEGEAPRVAPSKAKKFSDQISEGFGSKRFRKQALKQEKPQTNPQTRVRPTPKRKAPARRTPKHPLITIAQSPDKAAAEAGLARWKAKHPEAAAHLAEDDILIDRMRGSSSVWYRIRINLRHIPEDQRPPQETPDPDDDPTRSWREAPRKRHQPTSRKDRHQLLRRHHLELRIRAITRPLIHSPPPKLSHMPKPAPLHMLIRHLHHQLRTQRLPRQILPLAPTALPTRHPLLRPPPQPTRPTDAPPAHPHDTASETPPAPAASPS